MTQDQVEERVDVPVTYLNDRRYPGPKVHLAPRDVSGIPTQEELDAYPRMFTWGELKDIIQRGDLGKLGRNKEMQKRYDTWMIGIKGTYGSTEKYLTQARLPFPRQPAQEPTYDRGTSLDTPKLDDGTKGSSAVSGTSTPASVGFVSLSSLKAVNNKLNGIVTNSSETSLVEINDEVDYLRYDASKALDAEKYAVLANDWPYNVPYGVRHYCVWSKVPIAHPKLVEYDPEAWAKIEEEGLGGFTGVTPYHPPSTSISGQHGRSTSKSEGKESWYDIDVSYSGNDILRWAGVTYESDGGKEVGIMVKGLWDERGWECLWFVNPPRLQSIPGFSHFHVFARRKTPEEIDAAELHTQGVTHDV